MDKINPKSVRSGLGYFHFEATSPELIPGGLPQQVGWPPFKVYEPNYAIGTSTSTNTIGNGFKTFEYSTQEPVLSYGDLIEIVSTSPTVFGEMLGMVHTYSYNPTTGISSIYVEIYQSKGSGFTNQWSIKFQINNGSNIVQNPDSPYLSKLSVWDGYPVTSGLAQFFIPSRTDIEYETIVDTDEEQYIKSKTYFWGTISITEDMGDIHQPYLGTQITISFPLVKTTKVKNWAYTQNPSNPLQPIIVITETTTTENDTREYSHTFTTFDFDPASPDFQPATGHSPSSQVSETPAYVDYVDGSYQMIRIHWEFPVDPPFYQWLPSQETIVSYDVGNTFAYVKTVTPANFFQPPTT